MCRYFVLMTFGVLLWATTDAQAQRLPGYKQRPAISPYLFNNRSGGVSNYFQFVRPMQRQFQTNQLQTLENNYLQQQILGNQGFAVGPTSGALPIGQQGLLRPANVGVGQPAIPASYFNYSHYYYNTPVNPQQPQRSVRRNRSSGF